MRLSSETETWHDVKLGVPQLGKPLLQRGKKPRCNMPVGRSGPKNILRIRLVFIYGISCQPKNLIIQLCLEVPKKTDKMHPDAQCKSFFPEFNREADDKFDHISWIFMVFPDFFGDKATWVCKPGIGVQI